MNTASFLFVLLGVPWSVAEVDSADRVIAYCMTMAACISLEQLIRIHLRNPAPAKNSLNQEIKQVVELFDEQPGYRSIRSIFKRNLNKWTRYDLNMKFHPSELTRFLTMMDDLLDIL